MVGIEGGRAESSSSSDCSSCATRTSKNKESFRITTGTYSDKCKLLMVSSFSNSKCESVWINEVEEIVVGGGGGECEEEGEVEKEREAEVVLDKEAEEVDDDDDDDEEEEEEEEEDREDSRLK